jgi:lipopolysaccharide biosynthesis protein
MARSIAFYLPQFHPIPENDAWWGEGFTEWTSVRRGRPLFPGHYQPHVPADLGYYDLREPAVRRQQAALARRYGIEGFCYYHYWFAGRRLLERPFENVLASGEPDFPFCLCWANQSWTGIWHGAPDRILVEQTYPGRGDHERHFAWLLRAFEDPRYIRVEGKPLFLIFSPRELPEPGTVLRFWRDSARKAGLPGLFLLAVSHVRRHEMLPSLGFDGTVTMCVPPRRKPGEQPTVYVHAEIVDRLIHERVPGTVDFPCVSPNWDNTPRTGLRGVVLHNSRPDLFRRNLETAHRCIAGEPPERRLVFLKAWNEWAEGNHLEPDRRDGHGFLEQLPAAERAAGPGAR